MSYKSIIENTKRPNTISTLLHDLRVLGIAEGDIVLVHSSLSALGWVCGGVPAVVAALLNAVGGSGTIVMPSFTIDNIDPAVCGDYPPAEPDQDNPPDRGRLFPLPVPKEWHDIIRDNIPAYDKVISPCSKGLGRIAEYFRTYPGTLRSDHPGVSFTANGIHAQQIVGNHPLSPNFGMVSPLGVLYRLGAKVLLLGTSYKRCTTFHLSEDLSEKFPKITHSSVIMENGVRVWKSYENYDCDDSKFNALGEACEREGLMHLGKVGSADCKLFDMKTVVDFGVKWIIENYE